MRGVNNYYPYGYEQSERVGSGEEYRYSFNGMEKDVAIAEDRSSLDFGARLYNSKVGRFFSVDTKTSESAWLSPFTFAANDVIRANDLNGDKKNYKFIFDVKKQGEKYTAEYNYEKSYDKKGNRKFYEDGLPGSDRFINVFHFDGVYYNDPREIPGEAGNHWRQMIDANDVVVSSLNITAGILSTYVGWGILLKSNQVGKVLFGSYTFLSGQLNIATTIIDPANNKNLPKSIAELGGQAIGGDQWKDIGSVVDLILGGWKLDDYSPNSDAILRGLGGFTIIQTWKDLKQFNPDNTKTSTLNKIPKEKLDTPITPKDDPNAE